MAKSANETVDEVVEEIVEETLIVQEKQIEKNTPIYTVESPVKGFCGIGAAGVNFAYGKAEIKEGWVLDWYRNHGYKVTKKS